VLTSAPHWVELVTQIGRCEAFGDAWLTKRVRLQLEINTKLLASAQAQFGKDLVFSCGAGSQVRVTMVTGETCCDGYTIR
jgi:hypothetical protein